jgi:hypothetical protein
MKKILLGSLVLMIFSASIIIFNISCNKDSDAQPNSNSSNCIGPQPKAQLIANGKPYNGDYKFDHRLGWVYKEGGTYVYLNNNTMIFKFASASPYSSMKLTFQNISNPVIGTTYTYLVQQGTCYFNELSNSGYTEDGGSINLIFTRISNGTADGKLSGAISYKRLNTGTSPANITFAITDGIFSNIPINNN